MSASQVQNEENRQERETDQLTQAPQKMAQMSQDLDDLQTEQKLTHKLAAAGAIDLETAVLVAKARLDSKAQADVDACVAQLRKEKAYLFGGSTETSASRKTAGAKDRATTSQTSLEQAAKKAAKTGSRADLQHYLKLRKNLL